MEFYQTLLKTGHLKFNLFPSPFTFQKEYFSYAHADTWLDIFSLPNQKVKLHDFLAYSIKNANDDHPINF